MGVEHSLEASVAAVSTTPVVTLSAGQVIGGFRMTITARRPGVTASARRPEATATSRRPNITVTATSVKV